jgi:hypothetical protein
MRAQRLPLVGPLIAAALAEGSCSPALMLEVLNAGTHAIRVEAPRGADGPCDLPPGRKCLVNYAWRLVVSKGSARW